MKTKILALLLLIFVSGCKKDYEKHIRKVVITFSEDGNYRPDGYNWGTDCKRQVEVYLKKDDVLTFDATVCRTQTMTCTVTCAGKKLYEKNAKNHNVSVTIP